MGDAEYRTLPQGHRRRRQDTVAESRTSRGRDFRVSADLVAPPASSFLCYDYDRERSASGDDDREDADEYPESLVAAHGDSVLFRFRHNDYFVYRGGTASRPPSLSLLPTRDLSDMFEEQYHVPLEQTTTGLLRRSEDELLVIELGVWNQSSAPRSTVDLSVLRVGSREWEMRSAVPIVGINSSRGYRGLQRWREPDGVIPVGDRFLCWVKYSNGFLLCDMADLNLLPRSLPLPVEGRRGNRRYNHYEDEDGHMQYCRNMCGVGADALRFVSIDPCCCCGGPGRGTCPHSSFAFTVTTWTMSLRTDEEMVWVMDGVLDCEELWDLPGYEGLPYVPPSCPVISPGNPDVICFKVSDHCLRSCSLQQEKVWMLEVDMRRKVLLSVVKCSKDPSHHLAAKFCF